MGHGIQKPMSNISEIGQIWHAKILFLAKSKFISIELWVLDTSIHRFIARRKAPGESSCCCCATSNYEVQHMNNTEYFVSKNNTENKTTRKQITRTTLRQQHLDNRLKSLKKNDSTDSRNNLPNISLT
jgi:hypothetical protein